MSIWSTIFKHYDEYSSLNKLRKRILFVLICYYIFQFASEFIFLSKTFVFIQIIIGASLIICLVVLYLLLFTRYLKSAIYLSAFNDFANTSAYIWITGGPHSTDIYWYFTLILGLILFFDKTAGLICSIGAFINIIVLYYAEYKGWCSFMNAYQSYSIGLHFSNTISVFIIIFVIGFFVSQKDILEFDSQKKKDENI